MLNIKELTKPIRAAFRALKGISLEIPPGMFGLLGPNGAVFVTAVSLFLNVVLRNKHLAYVVSIGAAVGLFYLYSVGYNHWRYNPMLYQL